MMIDDIFWHKRIRKDVHGCGFRTMKSRKKMEGGKKEYSIQEEYLITTNYSGLNTVTLERLRNHALFKQIVD